MPVSYCQMGRSECIEDTTTLHSIPPCYFESANSITENSWNMVFVRMCATNNTSTNDIQIYKDGGRRGYNWVQGVGSLQGTNKPVGYTNDGNFIFHPPFSHPSNAAIGHFYMFWETDTLGTDGMVTSAQRNQMQWVSNSGSTITTDYNLYST